MASVTVRLSLTPKYFPLLTKNNGKTLISRDSKDSNYVVINDYRGAGAERDSGVPMISFMSNVLPTALGVVSVGYDLLFGSNKVGYAGNYVFSFFDKSGIEKVVACNGGQNLMVKNDFFSRSYSAPDYVGTPTFANIHANKYLKYPNHAIFKYNDLGAVWDLCFPVGVDQKEVIGISNFNNYLILYTRRGLWFSAHLNELDFTPSLSTGAFHLMPNDCKGDIVSVVSVAEGIYIVCQNSVSFGRYNQDFRVPFTFKRVNNSSGALSPDHVCLVDDSVLTFHNSGFQLVTYTDVKQVHLELGEFLNGDELEFFNVPTANINSFNSSGSYASETQALVNLPKGDTTFETFNGKINVKLKLICSRYACFSYGFNNQMLSCIIHDTFLNRYGRLDFEHTDVFEFNNKICFLSPNGSVYESVRNSGYGVLLVGKLQMQRLRNICLEAVSLQNCGDNLMVYDMPSWDGGTFVGSIKGYKHISVGEYSNWHFRETALNHSILITGTFNLHTLEVKFLPKGER